MGGGQPQDTSPSIKTNLPCFLFLQTLSSICEGGLIGRAVHSQGEPATRARLAVRGASGCEPSLTGWAVGSGHVSLSAPAPHLPWNGVDHIISTGSPRPQSVFFMGAQVGSERPGDRVSF